MTYSTITSKGQITIPKTIRKKMNIKIGDKIDFKIKNGEVHLIPLTKKVSEVYGILSDKNKKRLTTKQINLELKKNIGIKNS